MHKAKVLFTAEIINTELINSDIKCVILYINIMKRKSGSDITMRKIGVNVMQDFNNTVEQAMNVIKAVGFDAFFSGAEDEVVDRCARLSEKLGICYDTIHAPFHKVNELWKDSLEGESYTNTLIKLVEKASNVGVPTIIMHTTIGKTLYPTSKTGVDRLRRVVDTANKKNVKLAFENLEFAEPLGLILDVFRNEPSVGFCYDLGHEHCYTPGIKYLKMYGDRLCALHIHDNLGIADSMDVDYRDDLHRIPFDANVDYERFASELVSTKYGGTLMLEIGNRKDYDFYNGVSLEAFYTKAYQAASKIRAMVEKEECKL